MKRLNGKVAVVTGAAHGIGLAITELFAEHGAWVLIVDVDEAAGAESASKIAANGGEAAFLRADVSSPPDVERAVQIAAARTGRLDILCNNAAYIGEFHAILESTEQEWKRCIDVALLGTHHFTKAVLPYMIEQKTGSIVNIVSVQAIAGCPTSAAYTATKSALLGYTLSAAYDYGRYNIRVNSICPGPIQTRISPKPGDTHYQWQCDQTVLGRVGHPREVAYAALFLASDEASYITGANLAVDGGWASK